MVNKVILLGNLGADPEVRYFESGSVVAKFNIATNESYKNKNGERVTLTEWHSVELWDGLAKVAEQYLKQGATVYIEGKLRTETWTDAEGLNKKAVRIRATTMTMVGGGKNSGKSEGGNGYAKTAAASEGQASSASGQMKEPAGAGEDFEGDVDDLPF